GYLVDNEDFDVLLSMQHGLGNVYAKLISRPMMAAGVATLPNWVPSHIQDAIWKGRLPNGATRFPGLKPWGDIVVWINRSGGLYEIQVYHEYPENLDYYLKVLGNARDAHTFQKVYIQFNKDMKYFVEDKGYSPEKARGEIRRINDEIFKLTLEAFVTIM